MRNTITNANDTREVMIIKNSGDDRFTVMYCFVHKYTFSADYTERETQCINRKTFASEKTATKKANEWLAELN